jgi:hypothetical protein
MNAMQWGSNEPGRRDFPERASPLGEGRYRLMTTSASERTQRRGSSEGEEPPVSKQAVVPIEASARRADTPDKNAIARELERILASPQFHSSKRSQQFLSFVVRHYLVENHEPLKERTIGTLLFKRPADYATGDDSVVRVQAGEVRRRLEQYYSSSAESVVRIGLPLGSYSPEFRWCLPAQAAIESGAPLVGSDAAAVPTPPTAPAVAKRRRAVWAVALIVIFAAAAVATMFWVRHERSPEIALNRFWSPMFATSRPLLICLPKPIFYRPSIELYKRHELSPHEFDNEVDRMNGSPHLRPDEKLEWRDMVEYSDFGVSKGDVKGAFRLSSVVTKLGKDTDIRVGNDYEWDDLRNGPAIVIGAFSNPWTMKILTGLHFSFAEDNGVFRIQEQGPQGRSWYDELDRNSEVAVDYGLVTRLVNSGTGQFLVVVAGITASGSEAAAELASSPEDLQRIRLPSSADWAHSNVQVVVKTSVTDRVAGPARIVAVHVW